MSLHHLDLFSGIGGFAIAAQNAGFRTIAFCEYDPRCRAFLESTWGIPCEPDIRTLDARKYRGVTLLTGGPPCQPASRAGDQRGEDDDRWLWPEALRVLQEAEPAWCVFENPPGIGDVGLDGILSKMERIGYEVQTFDIPACAVDSPQLRHRLWIVGHTEGEPRPVLQWEGRREMRNTGGPTDDLAHTRRERCREDEPERGAEGRTTDWRAGAGDVAHAAEPGRERPDAEQRQDGRGAERAAGHVANPERQRRERRSGESGEPQGSFSPACGLHWQASVWVPCADGKVRRAPDDSFDLVDGLHRSLLGALGNSIVPQVAEVILKAIAKTIAKTIRTS